MGVSKPKIGKIGDISRGGLSFEYLVNYIRDKNNSENLVKDFLRAEIFFIGGGFRLTDVSCRIVYDMMKYVLTYSPIVRKRCGIKFEELTEDQIGQLGTFLANYTAGLAPWHGRQK
ncbi:Uncharacterized protein dnm_082390 [Desulfonema magnum]|uniref:Uncharacterized protein n=1 Tax=Desulfonema magnum TaxID=45655 RepID=A0A975BVQ2_9BACT|nr:Uncharacterized protein dnm_082390 [Desulfonema magnum]